MAKAQSPPGFGPPLPLYPSSTGRPRLRGARRVEERRGSLGHTTTPRFRSPLIKPDVRYRTTRSLSALWLVPFLAQVLP